jgi:uncharacterized protein (DUF1015 family)
MPEIKPLSGLLYDCETAGDINDLAAKPYDVISADQLACYRERSEHNFSRLSLPLEGEREDFYENSGKRLRQWIEQGTLKRDAVDCLYVYEQEFKSRRGSGYHKRLGFVCLVKLAQFEEGVIHPHEQTFSGPKEDRYKLMCAARAQYSSIFSIYDDQGGEVDAILAKVSAGEPHFMTVDDDRVVNRLWRLTDTAEIGKIAALLKDKKLIIADGHHRYETALRYREEVGGGSSDYVMMTLVNMGNPGLVIDPTHRLVGKLADDKLAQLDKLLADNFTSEEIPPPLTAKDVVRRMNEEASGGTKTGSFGLYRDKKFYLLTLKDWPAYLEAGQGKFSEAWLRLDTAILQRVVLDGLYGEGAGKEQGIGFEKHEVESCNLVDSGKYQAAFLLNPISIEHMKQVTTAGERMPQKSTYFYPKVESGFVVNLLEDSE